MAVSVSDWARVGATTAGDEAPYYCDAFRQAKSKWGGGKYLTRAELSEFLELLLSLQCAMDTAADYLFDNLPEDVKCRQRIHDRSQADVVELCSKKGESEYVTSPPFMLWSQEICDNPAFLDVMLGREPDSSMMLMSSKLYQERACYSRQPFLITIPASIAGPADRFRRLLTGHEVRASDFFAALNHKQYRRALCFDATTPTGSSHIGWVIRAASVPK